MTRAANINTCYDGDDDEDVQGDMELRSHIFIKKATRVVVSSVLSRDFYSQRIFYVVVCAEGKLFFISNRAHSSIVMRYCCCG